MLIYQQINQASIFDRINSLNASVKSRCKMANKKVSKKLLKNVKKLLTLKINFAILVMQLAKRQVAR